MALCFVIADISWAGCVSVCARVMFVYSVYFFEKGRIKGAYLAQQTCGKAKPNDTTILFKTKSIEYIIEDQAFSLSNDLAPPTPLACSCQQVGYLCNLPVCRRLSLLAGKEGGRGEEPIHTNARKPGLL
jgi:hypothetical protein